MRSILGSLGASAAVVLAAMVTTYLGLGTTRAIPAIAAATLVTAAFQGIHREGLPRTLVATAGALVLALLIDTLVLRVFGPAYDSVRPFRRSIAYPAVAGALFVLLGLWNRMVRSA